MLKIYTIPISLYCAKLRILLRHKNLQWEELDPPGGYGSDVYKLVVPSGNLPALIDDQVQIADSEAIAEYLNEQYPAPPMLPDFPKQRGKIRELSRFHDTRLEPEVRLMFPHIKPAYRNRIFLDGQAERINTRLSQLGQMLDAYPPAHLQADKLMLSDCGFPITFEWLKQLSTLLEIKVDWPQTVNSYLELCMAQPAVSTELAEYRPRLAQYIIASIA